MTQGDDGFGFLVKREGRNASEPYEVGDVVDVYPLAEFLDRDALANERASWAVSAAKAPPLPTDPAVLEQVGFRIADGDVDVRPLQLVPCGCCTKNPTILARVVAGPGGMLWVIVGREKVPTAFRRPDRRDGRAAHPLHPRISTAYDTVKCQRCGTTFAVEMSPRHVRLIKLGNPRYNSRVAP